MTRSILAEDVLVPSSIDHISIFFVKGALALDNIVLESSYEFLASDELDHSLSVSKVSLEFPLKVKPAVFNIIEIHVVYAFA